MHPIDRILRDSAEYAQRRANETGTPYAVWFDGGRTVTGAYYCTTNSRGYEAGGLTLQRIYRPQPNRRSSRG